MRRVLVVCGLVLLAHAPDAAAGDCKVGHRVIPADGTTGVPLNASVWLFGEGQNAYVLVDGAVERRLGDSYWSSRIHKLDLGPLSANHSYTVKTFTGEHVTTFTTGNEVDRTPPDPPIIDHVRYEAGQLSISARSNGSVAVWVSTQRNLKRGMWAWQLFPSEGFTAAFDTCNHDAAGPGMLRCVRVRMADSRRDVRYMAAGPRTRDRGGLVRIGKRSSGASCARTSLGVRLRGDDGRPSLHIRCPQRQAADISRARCVLALGLPHDCDPDGDGENQRINDPSR